MLTINAGDLPRFMACNGSRLMAASEPSSVGDTSQRDEGIAAHHMAAAVFNGHQTLDELIDRKAPNGVFMTSEMAQHVNDYLAICDAIYGKMEVDTSHDFSPHWVVNGRTDYVAYDQNIGHLSIDDFKYGWRIVEPENNWTLVSHAIGFIKQSGYAPPASISLGIFQPRPHHPDGPSRRITMDYGELTRLYDQMTAALCEPTDELRTSPHCAKCPALVPCAAARNAEMNSIDACHTVFSDTISNELLSFSLDNLNRASDMIKARKEAFEELAKHRLTAGQVVDGYSAGMGLGNSRFKPGFDGPMLKIVTGHDLTEQKLVTPAEAKRRGVLDCVLKAITERPPTGIKLERVKADKKAQRLLGTK